MNSALVQKYSELQKITGRYHSAVIAFSGGVDSTLLAAVAGKTIAGPVLLVTATSSTYTQQERQDSVAIAAQLGLEQMIIVSEELNLPQFQKNLPDRCYWCKQTLFAAIKRICDEKCFEVIFDGNNASDASDFRPGRKAALEFGVISPLAEANFTKQDIRDLSRQLGLQTAEKPALACLASRFPYYEQITKEKLDRVETVERQIRALGFSQFRVRSHQDVARIECIPAEMEKAFALREKLARICCESGFTFASLDLKGYRTGAMNEALPHSVINTIDKPLA
ncbi:MAG: ATP-dependent sacrificial sulfur transferase LarE [Chitinivibrionales bacterium]|nr:ATP-dependent sacrificial sulfur transferase LarE [Chitinivibrionales bacterium]